MRSVPPRGSGWVLDDHATLSVMQQPTRYRVVVLTSSDATDRSRCSFTLEDSRALF